MCKFTKFYLTSLLPTMTSEVLHFTKREKLRYLYNTMACLHTIWHYNEERISQVHHLFKKGNFKSARRRTDDKPVLHHYT